MSTARPILHCREVGFRYRGAPPLLAGCSFEVGAGEWVALVGPNGAGKSTLLNVITGFLPVGAGTVEVMGRRLGDWPRRELARLVAVVPQGESPTFPVSVREMVLFGRFPHLRSVLGTEAEEDHRIAQECLERVGMSGLADRSWEALSGGERQLVLLARALAQQPRCLLLDEATAFLDLAHVQAMLRLLRELHQEGMTILSVLHDLNIAARHAQRVLVLHEGRIVADGQPGEVLTTELIGRVYNAEAWRATAPDNLPWIGLAP